MSGRHPFSELTKDFSEERRRRIKDMKKELRAGMPLHDLRRARELARKFRRLKAGQKGREVTDYVRRSELWNRISLTSCH